ncbi:MAG: magnesium transporter MgtE N-terminal domain-containing protein, partial [Thermoanaerobaculia bacterium]
MSNATSSTAQLLYLLHQDPAELMEELSHLRAEDIAEGLRDLPTEAAAKVMAAMPFDRAVEVFDEPELASKRCGMLLTMKDADAAKLIDAMSSDQQADLFREIPERDRSRLLKLLPDPTRQSLTHLLKYPPDTAGGIMTTEFMSVSSEWNVEQALQFVSEVARAKETVYVIYVIDPSTNALVRVVSLRELLVSPRDARVVEIGRARSPITVRTDTDREDVTKIISKYNLLAVPVVDDASHVLG